MQKAWNETKSRLVESDINGTLVQLKESFKMRRQRWRL